MSNVDTTPVKQGNKPAFMQVLIRGRVESRRRFEKSTFTRIVAPAADPYSRPQVVEVRSKAAIGEPGEEITVPAMLGGYAGKPFKATDKETGEVRTAQMYIHTLDAIE